MTPPAARSLLIAIVGVLASLACACFDTGQIAGSEWIPIEDFEEGELQPELNGSEFDNGRKDGTFRFVTYNVHFAKNPDAFVQMLRGDPELKSMDVMAVQELTAFPGEGHSRARTLAEGLQMNYVYVPWGKSDNGGTNGIGLFSRYPMTRVEIRALARRDSLANTNYTVAADIEVNGTTVRIVSVHLGLRIGIGARIRQIHPIVESVSTPVVLGGDYNTNSAMWNNSFPFNQGFPVLPSVALGLAHEKRFDDYMRAYGFDTPTQDTGPTFSSLAGDFRIDSVFTKGLVPGNTAVARNQRLSDHFPLWVDISVP